MHIEKIIKFYFLFVMVLCSTVAVGADRNTQVFMANVLGYNSVQDSTIQKIDDRKFDFEIVKNKDVLYATAGMKDVEIMRISLKTLDDPIAVTGLKFKVFGVLSDNIEKAVLKDGDEVLSEGNIEAGYISFGAVGYKLDVNSDGIISVVLDFGKNVIPGERIRLDLEKVEDTSVIVGGEIFNLKNSFPVKGKALSIVSFRDWIPGYTPPKNAVVLKK